MLGPCTHRARSACRRGHAPSRALAGDQLADRIVDDRRCYAGAKTEAVGEMAAQLNSPPLTCTAHDDACEMERCGSRRWMSAPSERKSSAPPEAILRGFDILNWIRLTPRPKGTTSARSSAAAAPRRTIRRVRPRIGGTRAPSRGYSPRTGNSELFEADDGAPRLVSSLSRGALRCAASASARSAEDTRRGQRRPGRNQVRDRRDADEILHHLGKPVADCFETGAHDLLPRGREAQPGDRSRRFSRIIGTALSGEKRHHGESV